MKQRLFRSARLLPLFALLLCGGCALLAGVAAHSEAAQPPQASVRLSEPAPAADAGSARIVEREAEIIPLAAPRAAQEPDTELREAALYAPEKKLPDPAPASGGDAIADRPAETASAEAVPAAQEPSGEAPALTLLDGFLATAYCQTGLTATGTYTTVGRTLAVNPDIIPYGTHVWLYLDDGTLVGDYYAEDTGSNMTAHPYVVDIYMGEDSYEQCIEWGVRHVNIYVEAD